MDGSSVALERVSQAVETLTREQKDDMVMSESPLLLGLLEELKTKLSELRERVQPLLRRVQAAELPTSKGISFLSLKFQLLLSYCINVSFYLMLKSEGKSVKGHPVIKQLVRIRAVMEKIKPIDSKLRYQVEKLLKEAESARSGDATTSSSGSGTAGKEALRLRPNVASMAEAEDDFEDGEDGEDGGDDGVYRPPRLTATQYIANEKEAKKQRDKDAKARAKAAKSSLIRHLQEELYSDRPEVVKVFGSGGGMDDAEEQERQGYEEENFSRLMEDKGYKKRKKQRQKLPLNAFDDFDDFGDLAHMAESKKDTYNMDNLRAGKKKRKQMQKMTQRAAQGGDDYGMDAADLEAGKRMYDNIGKKRRKKKGRR